jgi:hypothetical protein
MYTKYFAQLIKIHGTPQLPHDLMSFFLNIVHLEAKKQVYEELNAGNRYLVHIRTIENRINEITGGLKPQELIKRWENGDPIKGKGPKEESTPWDENEEYLYSNKKKYH